MNGIHDLGGMHGFGRVDVERDEPVFHARWEQRVLGMAYLLIGFGWMNLDAFRHGIERTPPLAYLSLGYYGRWLASLERVLTERGILHANDVDARSLGRAITSPSAALPTPEPAVGGFERALDRPARFAVGESVRTRVASPAGHTRLPRYAAGRRGVIERVHLPNVYPDTNALGRGEDPQHLYTVCFAGRELWGADAEPGTSVAIDLFEPYLEPAV